MCEMKRASAETAQRNHVSKVLRMMIREDCEEAINLGLLTRSQAVDIARREIADWEFEEAKEPTP